ncbi:AAA family ATPase [Streptomyces sp. NBC_00340]|uniref:LuxR family transcriptional regulator n=1 Tax=Streptomyces sp. NBC_00340 TaxID=2975716 RepID=UPI002258FBD9|nr:LuxR family transcriptional regulator [Streptomyces sp. NBC_00340]MCX5135080.1 AAA family ATPase [Streptomyces sp. NBC_00340]
MTGRSRAAARTGRVPLTGRHEELRALSDLVAGVRDGMSAALVVVGEAGIGKTTLLDHLAETSHDLRVVRTAGTESEARLGFAGLHRLLRPFLDGLESLPSPQYEALASAFGMLAAPRADRYLVGMAALTLLADAASIQPLLCLVDDVQWLDRESRDALAFVARRLGAEALGLVVAGREEPGGPGAFEGLETLTVGGLAGAQAHELLGHSVEGRVDAAVAARIVADAGGNPLALLESAQALSPAHLAGTTPLLEPLPVGARLENHFGRLVGGLPPETRTFLVLLSAAPPEDALLLWRAAAELGVLAQAADAAVSAGVLTGGRLLEFRHPLIRSAVYRSAAAGERRRVHAALAAVSDALRSPERRAWHRAEATVGLDDEVADELVAAAELARGRGGYAERAALLARAAQLSQANRAVRLVEAARAHLVLGDPATAQSLLAQAQPLLAGGDTVLRARALLTQATTDIYFGRLAGLGSPLLAAAGVVADTDRALARSILLEGLLAVLCGEHDATARQELGVTILTSPALSPLPPSPPALTAPVGPAPVGPASVGPASVRVPTPPAVATNLPAAPPPAARAPAPAPAPAPAILVPAARFAPTPTQRALVPTAPASTAPAPAVDAPPAEVSALTTPTAVSPFASPRATAPPVAAPPAVTTAVIPPPPEPSALPSSADLLLEGFALRMHGGYQAALPLLQAALAALERDTDVVGHGLRAATLALYAAEEVWDETGGAKAARLVEDHERAIGALGALRSTLLVRSTWEIRAGRFATATACLDEAQDLAAVIGQHSPGLAYRVELLAWSGQERAARTAADLLVRDLASRHAHGGLADWARNSLTVLELSLGHYVQAAAHARVTFDADNPGGAPRALPDLIEASTRSDDRPTARQALTRLEERALPAGTPWALGLLERCRALVSADDDRTEPHFARSLTLLDRTQVRTELARTHLLYGEWLRRRKRRTDARTQLGHAYRMFTDMGAAAFAERARTELLATGAHPRKRAGRSPHDLTEHDLTPQERRIATLAAHGTTNTEIATRLFITQSTVEYHLNKIFRKLDITSRRQLNSLLTSEN